MFSLLQFDEFFKIIQPAQWPALIWAKMPRRTNRLCLEDYDCIGFDLDHTLCRYNVGNLVPLVYDLLAEYLVKNKGYDKSIRNRKFSDDLHLMAKGLTLDCERGNILRLGCDGVVLTASHGK